MKRNKKIFVVFVSSDNVFPYINSMVYAVEEVGIDSIILVKTRGYPLSRDIDLEAFSNNLGANVKFLADSKNLKYYDAKGREVEGETKPGFLGYQKLVRIFDSGITRDHINYAFLRFDIKDKMQEYMNRGDVIVDLTGADKLTYLDIFMACVSVGLEKIGIFGLRRKPDRSKEQYALYHNLGQEEYQFSMILKDKAFLDGLELFVARKNNKKLIIIISIILILGGLALKPYYLKRDHSALVIGAITIFTGIYSVIGAFGSFSFRALMKR